MQRIGRCLGHHERVLVGGWGVIEDRDATALAVQDRLQGSRIRGRIARRLGRVVEGEAAADVLGLEVELAALERRRAHLAGADAEARSIDRVALGLESLAVYLCHELGFVERIRANLDCWLAAPTRRAGARQHQHRRPEGEHAG